VGEALIGTYSLAPIPNEVRSSGWFSTDLYSSTTPKRQLHAYDFNGLTVVLVVRAQFRSQWLPHAPSWRELPTSARRHVRCASDRGNRVLFSGARWVAGTHPGCARPGDCERPPSADSKQHVEGGSINTNQSAPRASLSSHSLQERRVNPHSIGCPAIAPRLHPLLRSAPF
jgi:hypothetical protein